MIWKFHFSRGTLGWILAGTFVAGLAVRGWKSSTDGNLPESYVTSSERAREIRRIADSIQSVRHAVQHLPIDINTASADELDRLDGIGAVLSNRIVDYRIEHGPFQSVDDLEKVAGIGPKKLAAIREHCTAGIPDSGTTVLAER